MKTRVPSLFLVILLFIGSIQPILAEGVEEAPARIRVEDALGREVTLSDLPSRIVLAGRATIMLVDALYLFPGVSDRVVAVGESNQGLGDFFPVVDDNPGAKARLGRSAGAEEILAHNPDLVILKSQMRDSLGNAIESTGVSVLYLDLETPEQYSRDIRTLGVVLDQPERAEEIVGHFEERTEALLRATEGVDRPETLVLSYTAAGGDFSFSVAPEGWMQSRQVLLGGGEPVWLEAALSPGWNRVDFEQIAAWNPEVIVFISYRTDAEEAIGRIESDPLWAQLRAVQRGELYAMPADFYSWGQPDSRWVLGAEWFAYLLHPELFDQPFDRRILAFYEDFYGVSAATFSREIAPRLTGDLID